MPHTPRAEHRRRSAAIAATRVWRTAFELLESRRLLANSVWAFPGADGRLLYQPQPAGDKIGDYSTAGYRGGTQPLPDVAVKATVSPVAGDDTATIQAAINTVGNLTPDANGFRGVVLLTPGTYEVGTNLLMNKSGVILRGSGAAQTLIHATGTGARDPGIIRIDGNGARTQVGTTKTIRDKYVPVGAFSFTLSDVTGLAVGDQIVVH